MKSIRWFLAVTGTVIGVGAATPRVDTVEPPSWWAGHSLNPVRLLLRGENLRGTEVTTDHRQLEVGLSRVSPSGTSLLVDVWIAPQAPSGPARLIVVGPDGSGTTASFDLIEPLPRAGKFRGVDQDDVVYLLMPDRFVNGDPANDDPARSPGLTDRRRSRFYHGGDLAGVRQRLDYLEELGVTALWINPWYDNVDHPNRLERYTAGNRLDARGGPITDYHGYGAVDFYGVEEHLGTLGELQALVGEAQARGIKVIQDQVANHTGPYHPWVEDPPTPTWFNGSRSQHLDNPWQTWTLTDPHAPGSLQRPTLEGWFINLLPDLNQNDEDCARYLIQNSLWWVGVLGLDAIRQDTLPYVPRTYWRAWTQALQREYPRLNVIGEMFDGDAAKVSFFQGGRARFDGVDSGIQLLFDFPLYYPVRRAFAEGQSLRQLPEQLAKDQLYAHPEGLVTFLGLHDVTRFMNESGASVAGLKLAFSFLLTTRGIPLIYYGDEIAMRGGGDPDNRRDFPGGWPGDPADAFTREGRSTEQEDVRSHVCRLTKLRRDHEALRRGELFHLYAGEAVYVYARVGVGEQMLVALNNSPEAQSAEVDVSSLRPGTGARLESRFGPADSLPVVADRVRVTLAPKSAAVWELLD